MKKVLVTGAAGQIGDVIAREFSKAHVVEAFGRDLDITDHAAVMDRVSNSRPDIVINCAAFNDVDGAEADPSSALQVNALAVRSLARAAAAAGAILVHFSSDFVFDGEASTPYTEADVANPRSHYAASKLLGDWFAAEAPRHYILRVESLFGAENPKGRRSSVDRIIEAIESGREARVFVDRVVSPSYVFDVAGVIGALVERGADWGLYHTVNTGYCTWHELALEIASRLGRPPRLVPIRMDELELRAPRPRFAALSNAKLASIGLPMPTWQDALERCLQRRHRHRPTDRHAR